MGKPEVRKLDNIAPMDTGAPVPTILSDEHKVILLFYINVPDPNWDGTYVHMRSRDDPGVAAITFSHYAQCRFGDPNDEAARGHRYYQYGLKPYDFYEIRNSDLIGELEKMNRVHPRHSKELFEEYRHYVGFFHDSCFEIVAQEYQVEIFRGKSLVEIALEKIRELKK